MLRKTILGLMAVTFIGCSFVSQEALARGGGGGFHGGSGFHGGGFGGDFHGGGGFHGGGFHGGGFHGGGFHGHGVWSAPYYGAWGPDFFVPFYEDEYPDEYETCGWVRVKYRRHKHIQVRQIYRCW